MPEVDVNGVRLHYEECGEGAPILCIHGAGSSALVWGDALGELARVGRVIAYDRRGCSRSERPRPYERTSTAEQAGDAAALLEAVDAGPAIVIGRSYGGAVALDLALRHPDRVRALVLLEGDAFEIAPAGIDERLEDVAARDGVDAVGEAMIGEALGAGGWESLPEAIREVFTGNGEAILAELRGGGIDADPGALATIERPALVVAATDSPAELREMSEATARALPDARTALIGGGHLIDPASPEVLAFIEGLLGDG